MLLSWHRLYPACSLEDHGFRGRQGGCLWFLVEPCTCEGCGCDMLKRTNALFPQPRALKSSHLLKYCSPRHLDIVNQISLETCSETQMPVGSGVLSCAPSQRGVRSPPFPSRERCDMQVARELQELGLPGEDSKRVLTGKKKIWQCHPPWGATCLWFGAGEGGGGSGEGARSVPRWGDMLALRGDTWERQQGGCLSPRPLGRGLLVCAHPERTPGPSPTPLGRQQQVGWGCRQGLLAFSCCCATALIPCCCLRRLALVCTLPPILQRL